MQKEEKRQEGKKRALREFLWKNALCSLCVHSEKRAPHVLWHVSPHCIKLCLHRTVCATCAKCVCVCVRAHTCVSLRDRGLSQVHVCVCVFVCVCFYILSISSISSSILPVMYVCCVCHSLSQVHFKFHQRANITAYIQPRGELRDQTALSKDFVV